VHANTGLNCGNEEAAVNPVLGSVKSGHSVPAALGALLDARTSSDAIRAQDGLREAVHEIFHAISNLMNEELESAQASLQRAALALRLAPCSADLGVVIPRKSQQIIRGGLAPWQARVLKTHIETHLDVSLRTKELAELVQLSSFHFCRVFRVSFGNSPHSYVTRRRIERAQGLILATKLPLGQIAVDCGFADQAHFTKLFRKVTGESPGEWRRVRAEASAEGDSGGDPISSARTPGILLRPPSPAESDATEFHISPNNTRTQIADACNARRTDLRAGTQTRFLYTPR
jgi:AraC family transcriptional regulator